MESLTPRVVMLAVSGVLNIALLLLVAHLLDRIEKERKLFNDWKRRL